MGTETNNHAISMLNRFFIQNGFSENSFLSQSNIDEFISTNVDGYRDYPVFMYFFNGKYDEKTLTSMLKIDFKARINKILGISTDNYKSLIMVEPPLTEKTGMLSYIKAIDISSLPLLFNTATFRQDSFEKYAINKRKMYMDEKTWYIYIFVTRKEFQRKGYGTKLMQTLIDFADKYGYRLCLETNLNANVPMYENFGFSLMDSSLYKNELEHYVMLYTPPTYTA